MSKHLFSGLQRHHQMDNNKHLPILKTADRLPGLRHHWMFWGNPHHPSPCQDELENGWGPYGIAHHHHSKTSQTLSVKKSSQLSPLSMLNIKSEVNWITKKLLRYFEFDDELNHYGWLVVWSVVPPGSQRSATFRPSHNIHQSLHHSSPSPKYWGGQN